MTDHDQTRIAEESRMNRISIGLLLVAPVLVCAAACRAGETSAPGMSAFASSAPRGPATGSDASAASVTEASHTPAIRQASVSGKAELGQPAPEFTMSDANGRAHSLAQYSGRTVVLEWFNPRCAYFDDAYKKSGVLREMSERWAREGVIWLLVNSEGPEEQGSDVEENRVFVRERELSTPLLMDPTGMVGKAYGAKVTPEFFVVSERGLLVYCGALDNAPNGVVPAHDVKTNYVDAALRDLKSGHAVVINEGKPYGCGVRYAVP
jgi:hypothetical protein